MSGVDANWDADNRKLSVLDSVVERPFGSVVYRHFAFLCTRERAESARMEFVYSDSKLDCLSE